MPLSHLTTDQRRRVLGANMVNFGDVYRQSAVKSSTILANILVRRQFVYPLTYAMIFIPVAR